MRRRSRLLALFFLVVGGAMMAGPMTLAVAQTADDGSLGFFEVTADATGIGASFGNPGTQPYPLAAGLVPNASTQFSGGPSGYALSSLMWPGPLAANAGTLAGLVGVPLPPEVLANANYPVKAEAAASGGDRVEQSLGPMTSFVDSRQANARTALTDFASNGVVSAARVVTTARSYQDGAQAGSVAETVLQGLEIGGVVHIDTVRTVARALTDGTQATLEHEIEVSGVTVQGRGATIDQSGMHVGDQTSENPLGQAVDGFNEGFASAGMEAFVTKPVEEQTVGGAGTVSSGSVVFIWKLGDSGQQVVLTLGGALARVQATPGSALELGTDSLTSVGGGSSFGGSFGSSVDFGSPNSLSSMPTSSGGGSRPSVTPSQGLPLGFEPISAVSDRVPLGWMVIGIVGMALVGMGLHGLRANALDAALLGSTCPLEKGAS